MAAIMGHTYPDLYAAIGIHSGLAYAAARDIPSALAAMRGRSLPPDPRCAESAFRAVPTIVFHGDLDPTVHSSNGAQVIAQATPTSEDLVTPAFAPQSVEKGEECWRITPMGLARVPTRLTFPHGTRGRRGRSW